MNRSKEMTSKTGRPSNRIIRLGVATRYPDEFASPIPVDHKGVVELPRHHGANE